MASWNSLPLELRHSILEHVAGQNPNIAKHRPRGSAPENAYAWAPYAAVSRAWQAFFERRTFAALALQNEDVQPFSAAIAHSPERLTYIGRLQLTIDLPAYLERESNKDEDEATMKRHSMLFSQHLWWLLRALAAWKEPAPADGGPLWLRDDAMFRAGTFSSAIGMQLELGVRCVSDTAYRNYRFPVPDAPVTDENRTQILRDMGIRSLGNDGYVQDLRSLTVKPAAYRRVLGGRLLVLGKDPEDPEDRRRRRHRHTLPVAAVVRKLVLARSCTRGIHPDTLARLLRVSLPRVQSVHLEQWRPATAANRAALLRGYGALLTRLPPAVDRLSLFVESDCMLHYCERHPESVVSPAERAAARALFTARTRTRGLGTPMPDLLRRFLLDPFPPPWLREPSRRWPPPNLGRALAVASRRLVVLNAAFVAEADDVLAAVARMPATTTWPRLRTLVLTSATLTPAAGPAAIAQLLHAAAAAAARMPHLRQFELWHARGNHACAFTVVDGDEAAAARPPPRLRFRATWPQATAALTDDVLAAWRAVVATWTHRPLRVHNALQPRPAIPPWTDARRLVFKGKTTLARDVLCAPSRKDMAQERQWKKRPRDKPSRKRKRRRPIF